MQSLLLFCIILAGKHLIFVKWILISVEDQKRSNSDHDPCSYFVGHKQQLATSAHSDWPLSCLLNDMSAKWPGCPLTCLPTDLFAHWTVFSMTCLLTDPSSHWPVCSLTCLLTDLSSHWPVCSRTSSKFSA